MFIQARKPGGVLKPLLLFWVSNSKDKQEGIDIGNPIKEFKNSLDGLKQSLDGVKQSVDRLKKPVDEVKANVQETLDEAKIRQAGVKSEFSRMKACVQETKAVLGEVKDTVSAASEVLYAQKRYKRLLGRGKKSDIAGSAG